MPNLIWLAAAALPLIALQLGLGRSLSPRARDVVALATPLGLLWALNHPALDSWWIRDDPCHLVLILEHGIWRPFVSSIGYFLTPLLIFSLGVDFSLFELDATAFYAHQLISFSVLILAGYGFLRSYLSPAGASLALALFVVSVPSFAVARLLMNRHYLEGLLLALISLTLYRRSVDGGQYPLAILGAVFYLLATAAKEVFVPLVALLPFLAGGDRRRRWRHGLPFCVAAGVYALWRLYMLGWSNSFSGYGALGGEFRFAALLDVPRMLGLERPRQWGVAAVALGAALVNLGRRSRSAALGAGVAIVALTAPLTAVAARLEPRHLFLGAFAAAAVVAAAVDAPWPGFNARGVALLRALVTSLLLLLALAWLTGSHFWGHLEPTLAHHESEGRFVLDDSRDGLLMTTINHSTFLQCLARLRREARPSPGGPGFCGDACFCSQELPSEQRWQYADGRLTPLVPLRGNPPEGDAAGRDCDAGRPLEIELSHDRTEKRMSWTFGPYAEGVYEVLLISGVENPGVSIPVAIPRRGSMPYWLVEPLRFVVKYRSPEGWQTYSSVYLVESDGEAAAVP